MTRHYILPLIAVLGVIVTVFVVVGGNRPPPTAPVVARSPQSPYPSFIAGIGLVEAVSGNIAIGTPVAGVVEQIYVGSGDRVAAGDRLFKIDDRDLRAQFTTLTAEAKEAEVAVRKPRHRLAYMEELNRRDPRALSTQDLTDIRDDLALANATYERTQAQIAEIAVEIERRTVRAPVAGRVLQLNVRLGQYAASEGTTSVPLLLFGRNERLYVRVDIDETTYWRLDPGAEAMAFVMGNPSLQIPLTFEYIEPVVIPKTVFSGKSTERSDTRVLQVLYSFDPGSLPVYVGQQLDVFIQARAQTHP